MGNTMDSYCGGPGQWGPNSKNEDHRIDPNWDYDKDLSTCFEDTVLTSIPPAFLLVIGLLRIFCVQGRKGIIQPSNSSLYVAKQFIAFMLFLLLDADMFVAIYDAMPTFRIVSPAVMAASMLFAMLVTFIEHRNGIRNSAVMTIFWLLTILVDGVRLRTFILQYDHHSVHWLYLGVFIPHMVLDLVQFVLNWFKEPEPVTEIDPDPHPCPENSANFFSLITFWWMSPMLASGFKRDLTDDDLFNLNKEDQTHQLATTFRRFWQQQLQKGKEKASVVIALARSFGGMFVAAAFFKAGQDVLAFVSPQLLKYIIRFAQDLTEPQWKGISLAGLMFIAALIQSIMLHQYFHRVMKTGMRLRSALVNVIYRKSLVLSNTARQSTTTGEIVNLMAVDAQRFMDLMSYLHMIWSAPLQICLALYFLWELLGVSSLAGLGVMILMIPINAVIASKRRSFQKEQMKQKDQRIKLMNEILAGIKVLKLYGWEKPFQEYVKEVRATELGILIKGQYYNAIGIFSWTAAPFLVSLVTFITYTVTGNDLTAEKAFVALSLFNLLRFPLAMLPMMITSLVEANVSLTRIRKFLLHEEKNSDNVVTDPKALPGPSSNEGVDQVSDGKVPALCVCDGTFSWNEGEPVLNDINLTVNRSSLVAVVGRVGTGKSSLMSALLGDMVKEKGTVILPGSVAYVPQQAWMRNATLRDNITFGKPFDRRKYDDIIKACALEPDLEQLPGGDMAEIGEKGINLSGGQKQRVSLARAVYQNADVYLFDDPLSAVDAHVGHHIFDNVIGPGGLLRNKVRILVTHGLQYLRRADHVVCLRNQAVAAQGSFDELLEKDQEFSNLIAEYDVESKEKQPNEEEEEVADSDEESATSGKSSARVSRQVSEKPIEPVTNEKSDEKSSLIQKETALGGSVDFNVYKEYLGSVGYGMVFALVFMILLSYSFQIGSNFWLQYWSDQETPPVNKSIPTNTTNAWLNYHLGDSDDQDRKLPLYLGVYAGLGLGNSIGWGITAIVLALGALNASKLLHDSMLLRVLRSPMAFFDTTPLGRIVNRFTKDMYVIDETIPMSLRSFLSTFMQVISTVIVISINTPIFLAAVVPIAIFYYFIQKYYVASSRQLKRLESVSRSPIYAHFSETLAGTNTIRAYHRQQSFIHENEQKIDKNLEAYFPSVSANRWLAIRLEFVGNLVIFFSALFAVLDRNHLSPGKIGLSLTYAMNVTQVLNWMVRMSSQLETDIVAVERVEEYTKLEQEAPPKTEVRPSLRWPEQGAIEFKRYSVRYREGLDLVLRDITAEVRPGEKIGIVGRTGAGKSSLTLAMFRILEPATGTVIVDGKDITKLGLEDLRTKLTIMPQDPVLFSGSVRRNLDPFERYTDEQVWNALETCHMKETISKLDGGLDHEVVEGGDNFSIGQRQLMCLTRAVLRKTKILVLDEATAAVDYETDDFIQQTIRREFADCTILTIAHRLNTIMDSDRIMVLDKGRIAEFDSPAVLLDDQSSTFYSMAKAAKLV